MSEIKRRLQEISAKLESESAEVWGEQYPIKMYHSHMGNCVFLFNDGTPGMVVFPIRQIDHVIAQLQELREAWKNEQQSA